MAKTVMALDDKVRLPGYGIVTLRQLLTSGKARPHKYESYVDGNGKKRPAEYYLLLSGTEDGWRITRLAYDSLARSN